MGQSSGLASRTAAAQSGLNHHRRATALLIFRRSGSMSNSVGEWQVSACVHFNLGDYGVERCLQWFDGLGDVSE
jgi:hypothetical protein